MMTQAKGALVTSGDSHPLGYRLPPTTLRESDSLRVGRSGFDPGQEHVASCSRPLPRVGCGTNTAF